MGCSGGPESSRPYVFADGAPGLAGGDGIRDWGGALCWTPAAPQAARRAAASCGEGSKGCGAGAASLPGAAGVETI